MCFVRKSLDWVFTRHELKWLDDIIPESHKREKEEKEIMMMEQEMEVYYCTRLSLVLSIALSQIAQLVYSFKFGHICYQQLLHLCAYFNL